MFGSEYQKENLFHLNKTFTFTFDNLIRNYLANVPAVWSNYYHGYGDTHLPVWAKIGYT